MKTISIFSIILACLLVFSCENGDINSYADSMDPCTGLPIPADRYVYPVVPGTDEWVELHKKGMEEVLKACRIPEDILQKLSTQAVIQAFFDYPFSTDMYASSSTNLNGFISSSEQNPAYPELLKRKDAGKYLLERYILFNPRCDGGILALPLYEMILAQPEFYSQLNTDEKKELVTAALEKIQGRSKLGISSDSSNGATYLLIGRMMNSSQFAPFVEEVNKDNLLALYIEYQSYEYSDYDKIISYANQFIK